MHGSTTVSSRLELEEPSKLRESAFYRLKFLIFLIRSLIWKATYSLSSVYLALKFAESLLFYFFVGLCNG